MLKKTLFLVDFFLPPNLSDSVSLTSLFRFRSTVAVSLIGFIVSMILFVSSFFYGHNLFSQIGIILESLLFLFFLLFLKTRIKNFELAFDIATFILFCLLFSTIYFIAMVEGGVGKIALVWLAPLMLPAIFYLKPYYNFALFIINIFFLALIFRDNLYLLIIPSLSYFFSFGFTCLNKIFENDPQLKKEQFKKNIQFQAMEEMTSHFAHSINNPLFSLQGKMHLLKNLFSRGQLDLDKCNSIIEESENTILKISQMAKGVSTFAKDGQKGQMVPVNMDELFRNIILPLSDRLVEMEIILDVKIPAGLRLLCYPSYILESMNYLFNYSMIILENTKNKLIQVEVRVFPRWIEICLKTNGEKKQDHFDRVLARNISIAKGLIEIQNGTLNMDPSGNFVEFSIRMPSA